MHIMNSNHLLHSLTVVILTSMVLTMACVSAFRPLSLKLGLLDMPGGRKQHNDPVPLVGGISIFVGFVFSLLTLHIALEHFQGFYVASLILLLIGVADDLKDISARFRLFIQVIVALIVIGWGGNMVYGLGHLTSNFILQFGIMAAPLTVVVIVGNINSFNMIDGTDGQAGMVGMGQSLLLTLLAFRVNLLEAGFVLTALNAALAVFLYYNFCNPIRKSRQIFLGDAGSTFIAFVLVWFEIYLSQAMPSRIFPITIIFIMAYPWFDMFCVILRRLRSGKSPFSPGRDHLHHLLRDRGFSPLTIVFMITSFSMGYGVLGMILNYFHVTGINMLGVLIITLLIVFVLMTRLHRSVSHDALGHEAVSVV